MKELIQIRGDDYVSPAILQKEYGITYQTLKRWTDDKLFPKPIKVGMRLYYNLLAIERHLLGEKKAN